MYRIVFVIALSVSVVLMLAPPVAAEECRASWYGPGFHGRTMANGQVYDMYDPTTTACNRYPFGTWLKVTSLNTGRSVVVQVRDRGRFTWAVDLSYAAFKEIDDPNKMLIPIRYEVVSGPEGEKVPDASASVAEVRSAPSDRSGRSVDPNAKEYIVQAGDTLARIASDHGTTSASLIQLNSLTNPDLIRSGQVLRLKPPPSDVTTVTTGTHVVVPGETLLGIARRYGVSAEKLMRANTLSDPDLISIGQELVIAGESVPLPTQASIEGKSASSHTVLKGETLLGIALRYGITLNDIATANNLRDIDRLQVGQVLTVPAVTGQDSPTVVKHVVVAGDTLWGIAKNYGVGVDALVEINGIAADELLQIGQIIRLR